VKRLTRRFFNPSASRVKKNLTGPAQESDNRRQKKRKSKSGGKSTPMKFSLGHEHPYEILTLGQIPYEWNLFHGSISLPQAPGALRQGLSAL